MFRMTAILILVCVCVVSVPAEQAGGSVKGTTPASQRPYTPERGSAERKEILDALRVPVEKELKQSVIFRIDHFKVQGTWAFLTGVPQKPNGARINYAGTVYQEAVDEGVFDDGIVALLRRVDGKWRVIQHVIGATDVPYVEWDTEFKAPRSIFGLD